MGWIVGVGAVLIVVVAATVAVGWRRDELPTPLWDVSRMSASFTTVVGSLAGLSVASAVFLANLTAVRQSPDFGLVMAMFLIAFTILIATAMLFATVPNLVPPPPDDADYHRLQRASYLLAVMSYALGLSVAWFALRPPLQPQLRAWRQGARRPPTGRVRLAFDLGSPLITNLAWATLVLIGLPLVLGMPLAFALVVPDLALVLVATGLLAFGWGLLRTAAALRLVRRPRRSFQSG